MDRQSHNIEGRSTTPQRSLIFTTRKHLPTPDLQDIQPDPLLPSTPPITLYYHYPLLDSIVYVQPLSSLPLQQKIISNRLLRPQGPRNIWTVRTPRFKASSTRVLHGLQFNRLEECFNDWGGGGGNTTISSPWRLPKQPLLGIGLHDPLHGRQACPEINSFYEGAGQIILR